MNLLVIFGLFSRGGCGANSKEPIQTLYSLPRDCETRNTNISSDFCSYGSMFAPAVETQYLCSKVRAVSSSRLSGPE